MADEDRLLKQIAELIKASEERTKKELSANISATEGRLDTKINASEERLKQVILDSQEDTIETLKEYIHTAYNMLDKRIEKIEDELELPHPDKN